MSALTFDTYATIKNLTAVGIPEAHAEAVSTAIKTPQEDQLDDIATKKDIMEVKNGLPEVKMELKTDIAEVKGRMILSQWMLAIVAAVEVLPFLKELFAMPQP